MESTAAPNLLICQDADTFFEVLTRPCAEKTFHVCWDLDANIAALLWLIGESKCRELWAKRKVFIRPYTLFYIPGKVFSLRHAASGRETFNLYGVDQYHPNDVTPDDVSFVKGKALALTAALDLMGMRPTKLTSPIAIYEQCVLRNMDLPTARNSNFPVKAAQFAWFCSGKLWIESYQLGYWEHTYDYDIQASFPSVMRDLVDTRHMLWRRSDKYMKGALYGYAKCEVEIFPQVQVSPIVHEDENGGLSTPTGNWTTYLTKAEIDFIHKWQIGGVDIIDGWWCFPPPTVTYPYRQAIDDLLTWKAKGGLVGGLAKRMAVGCYGKTGEEREKEGFGPYFHPIYFAEISSQIRLAVAEFIYQYQMQSHVIHIGVDGVLLDSPIALDK